MPVAEQSRYNTGGITIWQLLLLVVTAALAVLAPVVASGVWIGVCLAVLYGFFWNRMEYVWYAVAASPALEVWSRMAGAPGMPYESGKYFLLLCIGLFAIRIIRDKSAKPLYRTGGFLWWVMLPGLLVGLAHFDFEQWVFNVLSIIELSFLLMIAARERWHIERFCRTLQFGLIAIIALSVYISFKSPLLSDLQFSLKANASASGGFGSNQVSTVLGAGIVLTIILLILKRPLFAIWWLNYVLLAYLLFRGLLTFSRGGMIVAVIAIIIAAGPKILASVHSFIKYSFISLLVFLIGFAVFYKINDMTGNMLVLRYEGETAGTYYGSKTKTLNTMMSGRGDVMMSDIEMFGDNWLFGVAPGQAKLLRRSYGYDMDVAAHTEYTRLMGEQGLGGLFAVVIIFLFPLFWVHRQKIPAWKGVISALFTLAILTAFHAATRTNVTTVFYTLAAIPVFYEIRKKKLPVEDNSLHR